MTKWYLHLYQGQGGVFQLPVHKTCQDTVVRKIQAIGSAGSRTCVCIYVKLDDDHCFAAHISAAVAQTGDISSWIPVAQQCNTLKASIQEKLESDTKLVDLVNSPNYRDQPRQAAICASRQIFRDQTASGRHIISALRKFFDLGAEIPVRPTHGFVRDHVAEYTQYWQYRHKDECNLEYYPANEDFESLIHQEPPSSQGSDSSQEGDNRLHDSVEADGLAKRLGLEKARNNDEMLDDGKGEDDERDKSSDSSGDKKEDASMASGEGSNSSGKMTESNPDCHELWPDFYGWEGTKAVDKNIGGVQLGAGTWDLFWSLENGYWDENHDAVLEKRLDCLQD